MIKYTLTEFGADAKGRPSVRRSFGFCAVAASLSILAIPACADTPLTLTNASFEIQNPFNLNNGCGSATPCYNFSIIDWNQVAGQTGTFDPRLGVPPIAPPAYDGNNVAFFNSGGPGDAVITQDLGILDAGVTYSISIEVSSRGPMGATPQAQYRLGAATGGTAAAPTYTSYTQIGGLAPANPLPTSENWATATLVFTPASTGDWYTFISDDGAVDGGSAQLEVDAVPEPSALLLLVTMIGGLALFRKKTASGYRA
jgi:hypothetical protein